MGVNSKEMVFLMQDRESMSIPDRVASFVVAAAIVVAVIAIAAVGPNTALSAATVVASEVPRKLQPAKGAAPESHEIGRAHV